MMKSRKPLLTTLAAGSLLFAGSLLAQDVPSPPSSTATATPSPAGQPDAVTMNTPAGELVVRSSMPPPPPVTTPPAFEQLSGGGKYISEEQAAVYPLLANDFLYADHNRDGRISKSEYERWIANK
ncbi:MAG: hypothetical protein WBG81_07490 [Rhodanobacter sp.]|uniref:hypothetical protein n=1 Tax=Rhodanobacter sp. KK11 TaxID=3083255 RepID=UPI00296671E0|nr:hypothetical protein [Rhodanobacter sp. KK11]MDW2982169.1 hypothetical protein [Rhodanobacter sp. KK11]